MPLAARLLSAAAMLMAGNPIAPAQPDPAAQRPPPPTDLVDVFVPDADGYPAVRIPAIVRTVSGTLLAFAEGRKGGRGDAGDIDVLMKRSVDHGVTWTAAVVIFDDGGNTCGNPTPLVDAGTGRIWLAMTRNLGSDTEAAILDGTSDEARRVFLCSSSDDGATWTRPEELVDARQSDWRWYATGPGHGIQLLRGEHQGRLVIPANHSVPGEAATTEHYRSHVLLSDDHGDSWRIGGIEPPFTNESTVAELEDGLLLHNMRSYHGKQRRAIATSSDGGESWSPLRFDDALIEPVCQASLLRVSFRQREQPGLLLFSNPAALTRERLTVRGSFDDGASWPISFVAYAGPSAYSDLVDLGGGRVGVLFEREDAIISFLPIQLDALR